MRKRIAFFFSAVFVLTSFMCAGVHGIALDAARTSSPGFYTGIAVWCAWFAAAFGISGVILFIYAFEAKP